jgi:hypothetical protein
MGRAPSDNRQMIAKFLPKNKDILAGGPELNYTET